MSGCPTLNRITCTRCRKRGAEIRPKFSQARWRPVDRRAPQQKAGVVHAVLISIKVCLVVLIILQQPVGFFFRWGRGTVRTTILSRRFFNWRRRCLLASEIGWRLGIRTKGHGASGNISALEQSLLGLLALIIGFTLLMALTRFEARREAVLNEANAIGTTALRARLLPAPHREESLKLLREYAQIRIIPASKSFAELPTLIDRSNQIQEALWQQVKVLSVKDNSMVPTGLFIQALNEMIDNQGKRLAALQNFIPHIVLLMLSGMAAVACGFAGYASGLDPLRTRLPVFITAFLVCSVIFVILDLDRPNVGFITISQQPMIDTLASLSALSD